MKPSMTKMDKKAPWFTVDRKGLSGIAKRQGIARLILEPIQNAWDEQVTRVDLTLEPLPNKPLAKLVVTDDSPDGFRDLAGTYTLYKESYKIGDPTKRGRFNMGEKLLLSIATEATIMSTTGTVHFTEDRGRRRSGKATAEGSILTATVRMTRDEIQEALDLASALIPPHGIDTFVNGKKLRHRNPIEHREVTLQSEIKGEEGGFQKTRRQTTVNVYHPLGDEVASLYEMGIPVDTIEMPFHVEVMQKVPLSMDRTSVGQAFLNDLEARVAEMTAQHLTEADAQGGWIGTALEKMEDDEAVRTVLKRRVGNAVIFNPKTPESNKRAIDAGYAVIHGRQFSKEAWTTIKRSEAWTSSSNVFDSGMIETSPDGITPDLADEDSPAVCKLRVYAEKFIYVIAQSNARLILEDENRVTYAGCCGSDIVTLNIANFDYTDQERVDELLIHECAHLKEGDHLTRAFYNECCRLGARLRMLPAP